MTSFPVDQVVVIGGTGQTGHRVIECILSHTHKPKIIATSRKVTNGQPAGDMASTVADKVRAWGAHVTWMPLNLEGSEADIEAEVQEIQKLLKNWTTALVFAAAFTNVEGCEVDPDKCMRINETNTIHVLNWARQRFEAKLVFYSTDYVFEGKDGPYNEQTPRAAVSVYGRSKVKVEEWLETHAVGSLIIRTTGVFDYLNGSKNFLMQMIDLWGKGQKTKIPKDQYSNPIWAKDLATATIRLIEHRATGIYNVAGGMQMSRTDWAHMIAKHFHLNEALIEPVTTADLGQKAKRPLRAGLRLEKLQDEIGWIPLAAPDALRRLQ